MEVFNPTFSAPENFTTPYFYAEKLSARHTELDYGAVMDNIDFIKSTRGNTETWPSPDMTVDQDAADLRWHEEEFNNSRSFAYSILNSDGTKCLGCFYIYPMGKDYRTDLGEENKNYDVDLSWWVTEDRAGLYNRVRDQVVEWLVSIWGISKERIYLSNAKDSL